MHLTERAVSEAFGKSRPAYVTCPIYTQSARKTNAFESRRARTRSWIDYHMHGHGNNDRHEASYVELQLALD